MKIIEADILTVQSGFILHQANCRGKHGAGLARALSSKWPDRFIVYRDFCKSFGERGAGCSILAGKDPSIVHVLGQVEIGKATDYSLVEKAISDFNRQRQYRFSHLPVAIPHLMGCGIGGGDWSIYSEILEFYLPDATVYRLTL